MKSPETLFVLESTSSEIARQIKGRGHRVLDLLSPPRRGVGRLRRAHLTRRLPGQRVWLDAHVRLGDHVKTVVIFDRPEMFGIARAVKAKHPHVRVILWLWNPLPKTWRLPSNLGAFDVVSFEPADVERYGFRAGSTFFFRELAEHASTDKVDGLIFIGRDKGRGQKVRDLAAVLEAEGKQVNVQILAGHQVPYPEVLAQTGRSRAVLDVMQTGQRGLTLRTMEALFLGVRLVTDNPAVLDDPHYPSDNVWLLGSEDDRKVARFLDEPPTPASAEALEYYDFDAWLGRLLSE